MGKKKGVHKTPEIHPHTARKREQERVQAEKNAARFLKRNRKHAKSLAVVSPDECTDIPESLHYVTSGEESEVQENTDPPSSSSHQRGTSLAQRQEVSHQVDSSKDNKETRFDRASVQGRSPIATQSENRKIQKKIAETKKRGSNISLTGQTSLQTNPLNLSDVEKMNKDQQTETQLGARRKTKPTVKEKEPPTPKKLITRTSVQQKSLAATEPPVTITQRKAIGIKRNVSNFAETGQASSQSIPPRFSHEPRITIPIAPKNSTNEPVVAKMGLISVFSNESGRSNDRTVEIRPLKHSVGSVLKIQDKNVLITMVVTAGDQVTCNLREHPIVHSDVDDVKSSRTLEDQATVKSSRTLKDQATVKSDKNVIPDPEYRQEPPNNPSNLTKDSKFYNENISSELNSVRDNIVKVCENFLKECNVACKILENRVMDIKREKMN